MTITRTMTRDQLVAEIAEAEGKTVKQLEKKYRQQRYKLLKEIASCKPFPVSKLQFNSNNSPNFEVEARQSKY